jgi:hypothetical protein
LTWIYTPWLRPSLREFLFARNNFGIVLHHIRGFSSTLVGARGLGLRYVLVGRGADFVLLLPLASSTHIRFLWMCFGRWGFRPPSASIQLDTTRLRHHSTSTRYNRGKNKPLVHVVVTLIFTYLIPIVPFILVLDGYVSAYRSREFEHVSLRKSGKVFGGFDALQGVSGRGHTVLNFISWLI